MTMTGTKLGRLLACAACGAGLVVSGVVADRPAAAAVAVQATDACAITTAGRIVAVADVHGAFDSFTRILREAGLINGSNRWTGGTAHLVQLGDVVDRGNDSRRVLDLLRQLERDAPRAGGRVHALLGNHEVMRMMRDLRYVSAGEYAAFRSADSQELREGFYELSRENAEKRAKEIGQRFDERAFRSAFLKEIPEGFVEMQVAFGPDGDYGRWLRTHVAMVRINGVLFVHGGVGPKIASLGCEGVNAGVRKELANLPDLTDPRTAETLVAGSDGPLWYRGLADEAAALTGDDVTSLLKAFRAELVVVGHTVPPDATPRTRFNNRVVQLDSGMLGGTWYPGGLPSALEIQGRQVSLIRVGKRQPMFTMPPAGSAAQ